MTISREEFIARFRGRLLLFLTEAWAARKTAPSDLGRLLDEHHLECRKMLNEQYDALVPMPASKPAVNGAAQPAMRRTT